MQKNNLQLPGKAAQNYKKTKEQSKDRVYQFKKCSINPDYDSGVFPVFFESCLRNDKGAVLGGQNDPKTAQQKHVKTKPKWLTELYCSQYDAITGELIKEEIYSTNEIKSSNNRKIRALDKYCSLFQPLYQSKTVTLLFYTLTQADKANNTIKGIQQVLEKRLIRCGHKFFGYIWTLEISEKRHIHYHMCVAVERLHIKGKKLPNYFKLDKNWGKRTEVDFVKKNVRHYMAKYFAKDNSRILGMRSYGLSIKKIAKELPQFSNN